MKKIIALLLALLCLLPLNACAADASIQVTGAEAGRLELALDNVPEGTLVTGAYQDGRMIACAFTQVLSGAATAVANFLGQLPDGVLYKAFVLDSQTAAPLAPSTELTLPSGETGKALVAYFSCTNRTKSVAEKLAQAAGADLYEITPADPYTSADLNYSTDCRANREQKDPNARPAIAGSVEGWDGYDVVFLGYPIWWGVPPKIIHTFMERYDFDGKTVIPFCTSGSSPYNDSAIKSLAGSDVTWVTGRRFDSGVSQSDVNAWVDSLGLNLNEEEPTVTKLQVSFNGHRYTATLAENPTAQAFVQLIQERGGSLTVSASDYGSFEKVAPLGVRLPANDQQTTTSTGDFVLYSSNQIVLFYGSNSWSYTRLGKLEGDLSHLKDHLGSGDVSITYALAS